MSIIIQVTFNFSVSLRRNKKLCNLIVCLFGYHLLATFGPVLDHADVLRGSADEVLGHCPGHRVLQLHRGGGDLALDLVALGPGVGVAGVGLRVEDGLVEAALAVQRAALHVPIVVGEE